LLVAGRASPSDYVSSPIARSVGIFFVLSVARATALGGCVACRTFQSYRIGFERKPFLLRGSVEKCATRNVNLEIAKNSTSKNRSLANENFGHLG